MVLISSPDQGEWTGTFGTGTWAAQVPLTVDDHFRIGSNTKTMTSTVILQLVQEGKLALDDPISKYIPNVPGGDTVTIANLSEMRSGLYSYSFDTGFNNTLDQYPQKAWAPQELLDIAFSHPVNSPPGGDFDYSDTNIILLGLVIEKLTGMTASEAFQQRIFTPLGLKNTLLPEAPDSEIPSPHAQGYSFGSNTSTIQTYALSPEDQQRALAGTLLPNNETMANPSLGMDCRRGDLDRRGHEDVRGSVGRRRPVGRADPAGPDGQHHADQPGTAERRIRAGNRQVRPAVRPRRSDPRVHDVHGARPEDRSDHRHRHQPGHRAVR